MRPRYAVAVVTLALALGACAPKETKDQPLIYRTAAGATLHLPASMYNALQQWNWEFEPFRVRDFALRVRGGGGGREDFAEISDVQALFAVLGDFDGDGNRDAAVLGHDSTLAIVVAV